MKQQGEYTKNTTSKYIIFGILLVPDDREDAVVDEIRESENTRQRRKWPIEF